MTKATEQASAFRALADMIESNPDIAGTSSYLRYLPVWWGCEADRLAQIARAGLHHGARVEKIHNDDTFVLALSWGEVVAYAYADRRDVCTRVVTGTHEVTRTVPDPHAPRITETVIVEDVEWKCLPILASTMAGVA